MFYYYGYQIGERITVRGESGTIISYSLNNGMTYIIVEMDKNGELRKYKLGKYRGKNRKRVSGEKYVWVAVNMALEAYMRENMGITPQKIYDDYITKHIEPLLENGSIQLGNGKHGQLKDSRNTDEIVR